MAKTSPLPQMYRRTMQHVTILQRKGVDKAHGEDAGPGEDQVRRYPELIAQIKMFVNEANRDKAGVVGIENGSKNYLLEAIIEVVFQHFNLVSHVVL